MIFDAILTEDINIGAISITSKSTRIVKKVLYCLSIFHLIIHRALHTALDIYKAQIKRNIDHITVFKCKAVRKHTVENEIIKIDNSLLLSVSYKLHLTKRSQIIDTSGTIKSIIDI